MPFDWQRAATGFLGGLGGDPNYVQKIDALNFEKQYKQFQMQQALEKLKMEKESHDVESKYRAALMKKLEWEARKQEEEEAQKDVPMEFPFQYQGQVPSGEAPAGPSTTSGGVTETPLMPPGGPEQTVTKQGAFRITPREAETMKMLPKQILDLMYPSSKEAKPSDYVQYEDEKGNPQWLIKGVPPPKGWKPWKEEATKTPPSAGNAVDLAIKRKFGTEFLQDSKKIKEADIWLGTEEGRKAVQQARDDLTPQNVTFLQSPLGYSPAITRGEGAGTVKEPTGLKRPLEPADAEELAGMRNTYNRLEDVYKKSLTMKGKFGPISGRWEKLKVKYLADGPTQEVISELNSLITIVYDLSGKQISANEINMIRAAMLPRLEQPTENFVASLNFTRAWLANLHNDRIEYFRGIGRDINVPALNPAPLKEEVKYSQEDLEFTAKKHGITVEEVKKRLGVK